MELEKIYNPDQVEKKWYDFYIENKIFSANANSTKPVYSIVIPPPNVTGMLHLGHVLNNTMQDILCRFKRMQGYEVLWMPGTDHAGIATQNVVEKELSKQKIRRQDLGREKFLEKVWEWKNKYGDTIIRQLKQLGCSCDWERQRFTMDEGLSKAVREVFVKLYQKGLVYRGKYIVNWCPRCRTALSDEESVHQDEEGQMWHIHYPLANGNGHITVATTRPETMLGDTAVAVHPRDPRYNLLISQYVILPIINRKIQVIADDAVDPKFGTGCVKVTPAHDSNDFWMGQRHGLTPILVMDENGRMNQQTGKYEGKDRFECRKELVEELIGLGLLEKIEKFQHAVGHCQRCNTVIEPYLSEQWFVKMKPLAEPAIKAIQNGQLHFSPERWIKVYLNWMENIRDWCISRQLWWGHRIPVYYCSCGEVVVTAEEKIVCPRCHRTEFKQDEDVLDTWFSSWLWPFSTMDWPKDNQTLQKFYPTSDLVTAADIIFFWVARMVMAGYAFTGKAPFRRVYFNSIVRDLQGRKMSKSLGNSPDPTEVMKTYGADALRYTIVSLAPVGQDVHYAKEKTELGRNFANKIWNASRFLISKLEGYHPANASQSGTLDFPNRWILSRLGQIIPKISKNLEQFEFNEAIKALYEFIWGEYCDWYLEMIKPYLPEEGDLKQQTLQTAVLVWQKTMQLLHPFMPFISEEIWQKLKAAAQSPETCLQQTHWPDVGQDWVDAEVEGEFELLQGLIVAIRNLRADTGIPPQQRVKVFLKTTGEKLKSEIIQKHQNQVIHLAKLDVLQMNGHFQKDATTALTVVMGVEVFMPLAGLVNVQDLKQKIEKEVQRLKKNVEATSHKLQDENFLKKAPAELVEKERDKVAEIEKHLEKMRKLF